MKKLKLLPLLFLALLCACLLTGCGKGKTEEPSEAAESGMIYTSSFTPIPWNQENGLDPLTVTEDGFYASCYEKQPGAEDEYRQTIYYVNQNGEAQRLAYEFLPLPENTEELPNFSAGSNVNSLFVLPNGELLTLESVYRTWSDNADASGWEDNHNEYSHWLRRMDAAGKELSSVKLDWEADGEDDYLNTYGAVADTEGRIWVDENERVLVFDTDGKCIATVDVGDWVNKLVLLSNDRVGAIVWGRSSPELAILDAEKGSVEERLALDPYPEQIYPGSGDYAFLYSSGTRIYGCDMAEKASTELLNLLDCDLTADQLRFLTAREDGSFTGLSGDGMDWSFVTLRQVPRSSVAEKQVLTLGALYPEEVNDAVIRFNRRHPDVRVEIVDYSQYADANSEEEAMDGLSKLTTEIMAGNMPDLLALQTLPYEQLAAKGLLEDLYPWIDGDAELSREDFIPSVLQASEMDGKLYQVSPGFSVITLIGSPDVVGEHSGWTFDELEAALATMPEGCTPLDPNMSRDSVLMMCLFVDMESYVNWPDASCDFENEDFYKLLQFCARFPAEPDYSADNGNVTGRISAGKQMLMDTSISSLDEISYNDQYFGGSCSYVGYPTRSGSGSVLMLSNGYAMSAGCENKEAAWEFLRMFLEPEYQRQQYNLPLRRDVLDEQIQAAAIEYEKDEKGEYRLDEEGNRIPVSRGGMGMSDEYGNMVEFELYGLTDEQIDRFMKVIESADKSVDLNTRIYSIVREEASAFFAGQKSPEEVAKLIQTKVSLYLGEQG